MYFVKSHGLHKRYYTPEETTHMFLTHLDNEKFDDAVQLAQNAIHSSSTIAVEHRVPAIVGIIEPLHAQRPARNHQSLQDSRRDSQCRIMSVQEDNWELSLAPHEDEDFSEALCLLIVGDEGEPPFVRSFRSDYGDEQVSMAWRILLKRMRQPQ